ncbi:MAG: TonB-dependent receptor [Fimbriimonadaceae bacterium]|nr:TonB-dependent receptor [Chitinophagales bacterium]
MKYLFAFFGIFFFTNIFSQTATLSGTVSDSLTQETLIGVNIILTGTILGAASDLDGNYFIEKIPEGEYNIQVSYVGYEKLLFTGIKFSAGENKKMDFKLKTTSLVFEDAVVIIGDKPLVDVEDAKTGSSLSSEEIAMAPTRQIQGLINTQTGVVQTSDGIHIRGGRNYETGFYIDDVSAKDPLAGTGFGIDIGSNSIDKIDVTTGGAGVEYGNATAGVVTAYTKSGEDKFEFNANYKRDNFGFNDSSISNWNQQVLEMGLGGPLALKKKLTYYSTIKLNLSDTYIQSPAEQIISSLYPDTMWTPYQDNRWAGMVKLNYEINPRKKIAFTYVKSLTVNQDYNMLRITGNDVSFNPGYQFLFALQPDNANTYTHDTNLESIKWTHTTSNTFSYNIIASRLFVKLRADANGRPWRPDVVNTEFDPQSIVTYPAQIFNPDDTIVFVNPGPGLYNNGGIATLWHDHYVLEYTIKAAGSLYSKDTRNKLYFGTEIKPTELQWIDITRPWIGASIQLPNGDYTQSFRLGDISDVWKVNTLNGAFFISDKLKYLGLIAEAGVRLEYWFPGKFVDDAVANPDAPIRDEFREAYFDDSYALGERRFKMRLLPKFSASFPIKENQVLFFNYGHSTVQPHPSYIYTGLDPYYADRSTLGFIGNPDLNPEVDISYELGLKSSITNNDALNITAFWKDKYDFITSSSILIEDVTGREVSRTIRINSDYARVRGVEIAYLKRIGKWFNGNISFSYSIATGQSSSASDVLQEILATGNTITTSEVPLAWDSPLDAKAYAIFKQDNDKGLFNKKFLDDMSLYFETIYRTGKRYTPYELTGYEQVNGRPIYEIISDPEKKYSEIGAGSFWINLNYRKWVTLKRSELAFTVEITNLLNNKNTAIVNPVTGKAWEPGDPVPSEWKDPSYIDPRDPRSYGTPPDNPARYYEQRHILVGISFKL